MPAARVVAAMLAQTVQVTANLVDNPLESGSNALIFDN
jgi:hypothetical protein